ncbi:hypothetical protein [Winogradskyella marincola]|uniref:Uncharacterized protein n=1 Tax=Winogradskyella marincola TaxID=3037795 RepID=A0ABT6FZX7_9FLAO|nr:hypothetical protein [Winogradskyella sp. YYF002]MDG4715331.1 hypothetical protein [Winogradskyella sp. YYF002]
MKTPEQILGKINELKKHNRELEDSIDYDKMNMNQICGTKDAIAGYENCIMYLEWVLKG